MSVPSRSGTGRIAPVASPAQINQAAGEAPSTGGHSRYEIVEGPPRQGQSRRGTGWLCLWLIADELDAWRGVDPKEGGQLGVGGQSFPGAPVRRPRHISTKSSIAAPTNTWIYRDEARPHDRAGRSRSREPMMDARRDDTSRSGVPSLEWNLKRSASIPAARRRVAARWETPPLIPNQAIMSLT